MAAFYEDVLEALHATGVQFVIVGGVAVILHGVPRTTADLDIVLDLERENVFRFVEVLERLGFRPTAPVDAKGLADADVRRSRTRDKRLKAFTMTRRGVEDVDVVLDTPLDHGALMATSATFKSGEISLQVAGIDALIAMKQDADRAQDRADVAALRRIKELDDG